jgi:ribonuclease Z
MFTGPSNGGTTDAAPSMLCAVAQSALVSRISLLGFSTAGIETAIEVPSLGLVLDLGRCSRTAVNQPVVLVSHGHLDHVGAVVQHAARRAMMNMGESVYVVPASIAADVERMFAAAEALDGGHIPRRVVPLGRGEELDLGKKRRVRAFETFHRVPSQGYTVWERRHRLRPPFRDLDGARLGELRRSGQDIDEPYDVAVLSFCGDTRVEVLERNPELQQAETLLLEATFLDARVSVEDARRMGHIHLDELVARSELLAAKDIVLHHFSARYTAADVSQIFEQRLPDAVKARARILGPE